MEELRVTKGLGRYTADFTSTLPAGPYGQTYLQGKLDPADSAWDSVKLLVKSDTTDGSTTFTDSSSSHTVTAEGGTTHETEYKKWGTSSIYFDGTNNTLTIADHEDFDLTSGSWTWEGWVYVNSTGANENLVSKTKKSNIRESMGAASKPAGVAPKSTPNKVIQEDAMVSRFKQLAGIK